MGRSVWIKCETTILMFFQDTLDACTECLTIELINETMPISVSHSTEYIKARFGWEVAPLRFYRRITRHIPSLPSADQMENMVQYLFLILSNENSTYAYVSQLSTGSSTPSVGVFIPLS